MRPDDPDIIHCYWWATNGGIHGEWYRSLPSYEQLRIVNEYKAEKAFAGSGPMRSLEHLEARLMEGVAASRNLAMRWAMEIEEAWKEGRPCPIKPEPSKQWIFDWAFRLAKVPAQCLAPFPEEKPVKHKRTV